MFGIGNGFLFSALLSCLKSVTKRTVPSFFGTINVGAAHCESESFSKTPSLHRRSHSLRTVASCICGMGNARA
jgi:hypothetical protein